MLIRNLPPSMSEGQPTGPAREDSHDKQEDYVSGGARKKERQKV